VLLHRFSLGQCTFALRVVLTFLCGCGAVQHVHTAICSPMACLVSGDAVEIDACLARCSVADCSVARAGGGSQVLGLSRGCLSGTSHSLKTNQTPATTQQYFPLITNQHQLSVTNQTNRLGDAPPQWPSGQGRPAGRARERLGVWDSECFWSRQRHANRGQVRGHAYQNSAR
jgi:hypothetical protein